MTAVTFREAINRALSDALEEDDRVFLLGEDIGAAGGAFKVTDGLFDEFGDRRIRDTPISEQAIIGTAIGAAMKGLRPVAELMFADFTGVCYDQIANQLAKYRYMTGGQVTVPVTIRMANGAGGGFASQHSQTVENWFLNVPGLKIAVPGSPADAYDLMRAAVRDENPVLFFEHKSMMNVKGPLGDDHAPTTLGRAAIVLEGSDVTVVATQLMRVRAEEAAAALAGEGISVELIDPRTLVPLDMETIGSSLEKTGHLLVVQESPFAGSWGATILAALTLERFEMFDAPPAIVCGDDTPVPYAGNLEDAWLPTAERIIDGVKALVRG
ncbi:MAG: acetoin:2,6-dichlorophenolindophenol oxidoreductase subunit beta [Gaiellales bacterium]|nr:acetoin:2,6-dichlorophenolindophenol oxidoreductase subunit beta [Gaiellales bacterium]